MRRRYRRVGFTTAQSAELWERWKKGEGLKSIGRVFGKPSSCIFAHIRPSGGIKPPPRRRAPRALDPFRARRNLQRPGRRPLAPHDRSNVGALALDDQPRDQPQWRCRSLSGRRRRQPGLEARTAPEAMQVGGPCSVAASCCKETGIGLVAGADRRMAEAHVSAVRGAARVA